MRWANLESMRHGHKQILIGPRSAVFAPFQNLALIIVELMRGGQRWRYCQIRPMTVGEMSSMADLLRTGRVVGEVVK